ncbi:MAG: potassium-transporting ATPase subunit B, partial [Gemmatimonadaceae bacterium]
MAVTKRPLFDPPIVKRAIGEAFAKTASPRHMVRNPVMFVVLLGSAITTLVLLRDVLRHAGGIGFTLQLSLWLWFTVVFANFAEAMAEGRGKAQADSLRAMRTTSTAKRLDDPTDRLSAEPVPATTLRRGDYVLC